MSTPLPHTARGEADGRPPVVLLHGFAGDALGWTSVQLALERRRRSIAFDLPAVHLVGHSMGGAVAALIALRDPGRIASLTLVAPGGFGPEINHRLLRRFAAARTESEIAPLLEQFFGYSARLPRRMAAQIALGRDEPGRVEALTTVAEAILDGEGQRTVDRDGLGALAAPVRVIWGEDDRVLPVRQSTGLAGAIAVHRFAGVGHMPHLEVPSAVARVVAEQIAGA